MNNIHWSNLGASSGVDYRQMFCDKLNIAEPYQFFLIDDTDIVLSNMYYNITLNRSSNMIKAKSSFRFYYFTNYSKNNLNK